MKRECLLNNGEEKLKQMLLTPNEKALMDVLFGGELTEEVMHILLENFDINHANQNYILMLSCLGYKKNWKFFPPEIIPRLKGIHRYYQVRNSIGIPWLVKQLRILSDAGIPIMLIKGIAMRAHYAKDTPRLMWDYDIVVPVEDFDRAVRLLLDAGNTFIFGCLHSVSMKKDWDEMDVHRWIFKTYGEETTDIWKRARTFCFHGIDVYVPSPEDMFIHLLDTLSRNHFSLQGIERRMQWLYDCRSIWEGAGGMSLKYLATRAEEFHAKARVSMILRLFMQCFPELIDEKELEGYFPKTAEYERLLVTGEKFRQEYERFRIYGYTAKSILTPVHIWRVLRVEKAQYHYNKPELQRIDSKVNFFRYIVMEYCLNNFSILKKGYLSRLGFFDR